LTISAPLHQCLLTSISILSYNLHHICLPGHSTQNSLIFLISPCLLHISKISAPCFSHSAATCCRTQTLKLLFQSSAFSRYFLCIRSVCSFASYFKTLISTLISNFHYLPLIFDPFFRGPRLEAYWECLSIDASPCRTYLSSSKSYRLPEEDLQILCYYLWLGIKLHLVARINEAGVIRGQRLAFFRYEL
jgi:hypothetical protein